MRPDWKNGLKPDLTVCFIFFSFFLYLKSDEMLWNILPWPHFARVLTPADWQMVWLNPHHSPDPFFLFLFSNPPQVFSLPEPSQFSIGRGAEVGNIWTFRPCLSAWLLLLFFVFFSNNSKKCFWGLELKRKEKKAKRNNPEVNMTLLKHRAVTLSQVSLNCAWQRLLSSSFTRALVPRNRST